MVGNQETFSVSVPVIPAKAGIQTLVDILTSGIPGQLPSPV